MRFALIPTWLQGVVKITKKEFEARYCERNNISIVFYRTHLVTLPCACGGDSCEGWAAVSDNPEAIREHNELYAPKSIVYLCYRCKKEVTPIEGGFQHPHLGLRTCYRCPLCGAMVYLSYK